MLEKSTPCFVLLMRGLLLSHSYSMDQRTHNKITPQVDLSLVFQGLEVRLECSRRT